MQKSQRPEKGHCAYFRNRETLLAMTASAALLAGLATSADALPLNAQAQGAPQAGRQGTLHRTVLAARDKAPVKPKQHVDDVAAKAKGVLSVVISLNKQRLTLYSDGQPIAYSRVSTGVPGRPTPTGVFSVIQKDRWHRSNLYDNAPMFYMQRITWSGVAMHQGIVPNYPASHGCIRLPEAFARQMWGITRLGVRVIVAHGDVTPVPIANERLFTFKPAPVEPKPEEQAASNEPAKAGHDALEAIQFAANKDNATASDAAKAGNAALDAMAYAVTAPRETPVTASEVVKSAHDAFETVTPQGANPATIKSATVTTGEEVRPLKPGPISVFISRREGKLFVRKGFEPVFDAPVTFEHPEQPLGTHVFTAVAFNDDNTTLRWNVMTMPGSAVAPAKKPVKGKKAEPAAPAMPASSAAEALDRVSIPQDALDRISQLISPGASLIISDKGLGSETGKGTDFIVLTR
ncbi:MAG TPA: L,D-transpeptidase [Xanthobacteraceae bacterium]